MEIVQAVPNSRGGRTKNGQRSPLPSQKSVRYSFALAPPSLRSLGRRSPLFSRATKNDRKPILKTPVLKPAKCASWQKNAL